MKHDAEYMREQMLNNAQKLSSAASRVQTAAATSSGNQEDMRGILDALDGLRIATVATHTWARQLANHLLSEASKPAKVQGDLFS